MKTRIIKHLKKIKTLSLIKNVVRGYYRKSCFLFLQWKMALRELFFKPVRPDITVVGYIKEADGLGRLPQEVIESLSDKLSINFLSTRVRRFADVSSRVKK